MASQNIYFLFNTNLMRKNFLMYVKYVLFISIFLMIVEKRIEYLILNSRGMVTIARVKDVRTVGSKGTIQTQYTFSIDGKEYNSKSTNIKNIGVGGSIDIVYWHFFPSINESFEHLQQFK